MGAQVLCEQTFVGIGNAVTTVPSAYLLRITKATEILQLGTLSPHHVHMRPREQTLKQTLISGKERKES